MSFKTAAEDLCITPSAVSHQIKTLEEQLGVTLFKRGARSIALTPAGSSLYSRIDPLLRDLEQATSAISSRERRRFLRLTSAPFFASELFIPHFNDFPSGRMSVDLHVDGNEMRGGVRMDGSDAAILMLPQPPPGLRSDLLFRVRLVPACSPRVAARLGDAGPGALRNETLIAHRGRPNAWGDWLRTQGFRQRSDARVFYVDSMYAVVRAAERGLGVALVPSRLAAAWFQRQALVKLFDAELVTDDSYYFVFRHEDAEDADIMALREWIMARCAG